MITIARLAAPLGLERALAAHLARDRDTNRILAGASAARAPQAWLLACDAATVVGAICLPQHGPALWSAMSRAAALPLATRWQQHASHAACLVPPDIADIVAAAGSGAVSTTRLAVLVATAAPAAAGPGTLRRATHADRPWLPAWFLDYQRATGGGDQASAAAAFQRWVTGADRTLYLWEPDGIPRAMVGHGLPGPHGVRIAAVYVPPAERRRGHAAAAVAQLCQRLAAGGHAPWYLLVDIDDIAAWRLYHRLGFVAAGRLCELRWR